MGKITAVIPFSAKSYFTGMIQPLMESPLIDKVIVLHDSSFNSPWPKCEGMRVESLTSGRALNELIKKIKTDFLFIHTQSQEIHITPGARNVLSM